MEAPILFDTPDKYDKLQSDFVDFLNTFCLADPAEGPTDEPYYVGRLRDMKMGERLTLEVKMPHLFSLDDALTEQIQAYYYRVEPYLRKALQAFIRQHQPEMLQGVDGEEREYFVRVVGLAPEKMRDLRTERVGQLVAFCGTVTRTSEVRPELFLGAFKCLECQALVRGVEQQFKYTVPLICSNTSCGNRKMWSLQREESVFVDWQRLKVQESADEVPAGSLPRTMDVVMRNDIVEHAKAGDKMVFHGSLVVVPDVAVLAIPGERVSIKSSSAGRKDGAEGISGLSSTGARELTYRLMFIACSASPADAAKGQINIRSDERTTPEGVLAEYPEDKQEEVLAMSRRPDIYISLARSVCPSTFGHDNIKQAVLLMLMGGVHKTTKEGINLRGDINVAIVGDPSCGKSQMLKYVAAFLPRAVYTSGKASTAAGLTASVVKEPENNEFAIEAGALMLADNGICCIDEFDKMDVKDQVAIHEAMEQQTISIAKAGIQATLNARASILAAANPISGRYDKSKPLKYNVSLPPAILSRFDLLHVMVDDTDEEQDARIATHILSTHRLQAAAFQNIPYTTEQLQRYIRYARSIRPTISDEAHTELVKAYKELRRDDAAPGTQTSYRITVRQLEAMVRLSEAMARVHCESVITRRHVAEAKRLLKASILTVEQSDVDLEDALPDVFLPPEDVPNPESMDVDGMAQEAHLQPDSAAASGEDDAVTASGSKRARPSSPGEPSAVKRARTAADGAADAAATSSHPAGSTAAVAGDAMAVVSAPAPKQPQRVTAQKFQAVKAALVKKMLDVEEEQRRRAADAGSSEVEEAGIPQGELMKWYLELQSQRGALTSMDQTEAEFDLVAKIIQHLIKKDNVLTVLSGRMEMAEGESREAFLQRLQVERVLALHANFAPEDA